MNSHIKTDGNTSQLIGQNMMLLQILHKTEKHRFVQNDKDSFGCRAA